MSILSKEKLKQFGIPVLTLVIGFTVGWFLPPPPGTPLYSDQAIRETGKYKLTAPLLLCATTATKDFGEYKALHDSLQQIIDDAKSADKVDDVSVYFRGFGGKWVGINENDSYAPASLLKVPLMIAYFKEAESNPSIFEHELSYNGSFDENAAETFKSQYDIKPGVYKVIDLLKAMIINSDNNATTLLNDDISANSLSEIYTDLGIVVPPGDKPVAEIISAKEYSYFFRILYNSTYLTPESSEQALEMLSTSDFHQGLRGGVPENVTIAQKFGERSVLTSDGKVQERDLHDCGLIYYTSNPYLLCVMTKGKDFKDLSSVIQAISKRVYDEVASAK